MSEIRIPTRTECSRAAVRLAEILAKAKRTRGLTGYHNAIGYWTELTLGRLSGNTIATFKAYEVMQEAQRLMEKQQDKESKNKGYNVDDDWQWPTPDWTKR